MEQFYLQTVQLDEGTLVEPRDLPKMVSIMLEVCNSIFQELAGSQQNEGMTPIIAIPYGFLYSGIPLRLIPKLGQSRPIAPATTNPNRVHQLRGGGGGWGFLVPSQKLGGWLWRCPTNTNPKTCLTLEGEQTNNI